MKKKILLVTDNDKWAFHNIATHFKSFLNKYYDIDIVDLEYLNGNVVDLFLLGSNYDLVHIFWRGFFFDLDNDFSRSYIYNLGLSFEDFVEEYIKSKNITTCVYDHKLIEEKDINYYTKFVKDYYVSSKKLFKLYKEKDLDKKPSKTITDGIDLKMFYPKANKFANIKKKTIQIGWAGNSKWDGETDHKGLNTIIIPCIKKLKKAGYDINLNLADSNIKLRKITEMKDYYDDIDLYLCCSINEGTPNPVLEAMACGIPVISTDVGIVKDAFGKEQRNFIMRERTIDELYNKIVYLLENKDLFKKLSEENIKQIKSWTWEKKALDFKKFIDNIMK